MNNFKGTIVCCDIDGRRLAIFQDKDDKYRVFCDDKCISDPYYGVSYEIANAVYIAAKVVLSEVL